ncbi:hypothetical protein DFH11DRAFT_283148 [Phellopilus nigrolimitatus]|nr:hypothetical protein DFH11DRAFT_283148 [Phellopilus nigrolimitatus]
MLNSSGSSPSHTAQASNEQKQSTGGVSVAREERAGSANMGVDAALAEPFASFAHQDVLVRPYDDELRRDVDFQEQLHQLLLELVLEFHAWSTSRPELESTAAGDALFEETQAVLNTEREQGMLSFLFGMRTRISSVRWLDGEIESPSSPGVHHAHQVRFGCPHRFLTLVCCSACLCS